MPGGPCRAFCQLPDRVTPAVRVNRAFLPILSDNNHRRFVASFPVAPLRMQYAVAPDKPLSSGTGRVSVRQVVGLSSGRRALVRA